MEIASLRKQAEAFNTPSTYVKCVKYQRLANAKEKELAALQQARDQSLHDKVDAVVTALKVRGGAALLQSSWSAWLVLLLHAIHLHNCQSACSSPFVVI